MNRSTEHMESLEIAIALLRRALTEIIRQVRVWENTLRRRTTGPAAKRRAVRKDPQRSRKKLRRSKKNNK